VISDSFPRTRDLFMIRFADGSGSPSMSVDLWAAIEPTVPASLYTVALVAVSQIDSPRDIFLAGVNRGATVVGTAPQPLRSILRTALSLRGPSASPLGDGGMEIRRSCNSLKSPTAGKRRALKCQCDNAFTLYQKADLRSADD
jgi:hypothetical protein